MSANNGVCLIYICRLCDRHINFQFPLPKDTPDVYRQELIKSLAYYANTDALWKPVHQLFCEGALGGKLTLHFPR